MYEVDYVSPASLSESFRDSPSEDAMPCQQDRPIVCFTMCTRVDRQKVGRGREGLFPGMGGRAGHYCPSVFAACAVAIT